MNTDTLQSLRDQFAGQAIQAIIIATTQDLLARKEPTYLSGLELGLAQEAYNVADAMLEARKQKEPTL